MTDLSILCLHNSTTSWESQQRGGIVEDVMGNGEAGGGGRSGCCDGWIECELTGGRRRWGSMRRRKEAKRGGWKLFYREVGAMTGREKKDE